MVELFLVRLVLTANHPHRVCGPHITGSSRVSSSSPAPPPPGRLHHPGLHLQRGGPDLLHPGRHVLEGTPGLRLPRESRGRSETKMRENENEKKLSTFHLPSI